MQDETKSEQLPGNTATRISTFILFHFTNVPAADKTEQRTHIKYVSVAWWTF